MSKRDPLAEYNRKRDFGKTAEPSGKRASSKGGNRFIVQKHAATRLHRDFRLEADGVLKSWAVTKGPSPDPEVKRLAVRTEDHPLSYAEFEGTIPKGEYGGGTVMLWDKGTWEPVEGKSWKDIDKGHLHFTLDGERMDPLRVFEATGAFIGIIGAGLIVFSGGQVKNLTTAAHLWLAAVIGIACGAAQWPLVAIGAGISVVMLTVLRIIERRWLPDEDYTP